MADQIIPIGGFSIDNTELTRSDNVGTLVERQRINIGSPTDTSARGLADVSDRRLGVYGDGLEALLTKILLALRYQNTLLSRWLGDQLPEPDWEE